MSGEQIVKRGLLEEIEYWEEKTRLELGNGKVKEFAS